MLKVKVSKKQMRQNFKIISAGYCELQFLLYFKSPIAYSVGSYGWACDYYDIDGVVISTGYSPIPSKRTNTNYEMIKKYNNKANVIITNYEVDYNIRKKQVTKLLHKFIKEAVDNA